MFTLFVILVFGWLFFKSVGLAFHLTWGLAKIVATLLFGVALPHLEHAVSLTVDPYKPGVLL